MSLGLMGMGLPPHLRSRSRIEILRSADGKWFIRVTAPNGQILSRSETYNSLQAAENGRESLIKNIKRDFPNRIPSSLGSIYLGRDMLLKEIYRTNDGGWYFKVKAANGETLCHSETYSSEQAAETGFRSLINVIHNYSS